MLLLLLLPLPLLTLCEGEDGSKDRAASDPGGPSPTRSANTDLGLSCEDNVTSSSRAALESISDAVLSRIGPGSS